MLLFHCARFAPHTTHRTTAQPHPAPCYCILNRSLIPPSVYLIPHPSILTRRLPLLITLCRLLVVLSLFPSFRPLILVLIVSSSRIASSISHSTLYSLPFTLPLRSSRPLHPSIAPLLHPLPSALGSRLVRSNVCIAISISKNIADSLFGSDPLELRIGYSAGRLGGLDGW